MDGRRKCLLHFRIAVVFDSRWMDDMVFSKDFLDSVVLSSWGLGRGGHLGGNSVWRTR